MAASVSRHRPGSWVAVVSSGVWLLADVAPDDPVVERFWSACEKAEYEAEGEGADAVLGDLVHATGGASGGFAFVRRAADVTWVVVRGQAVAEITDSAGEVRVVRHEGDAAGSELVLRGESVGVRLASPNDVMNTDAVSLPVSGGVVMASAIEYLVKGYEFRRPQPTVAEPALAEPVVEPSAVAEAAQGDGEDGFLDDFMEPGGGVAEAEVEASAARDPLESTTRTRVLEASDLGWMSRSAEPSAAQSEVAAPEPVVPEPEPTVVVPERAPEPEPIVPVPQVAPVQPVQALPPDDAFIVPPPAPPPAQTMFGASDQPLVTAVRCLSGHLTPAESVQCRTCHAAVPPQEPVTVVRPSLGRLRLSNGETYTLDRDAVFGRKPEVPLGRPGARPNAIALTDDRDVSRNHVEIRLDGWRVLAIDLGSMNGTRLAGPNLVPQLLPPMAAQEIGPGSVLTLAPDVWIYFEEDR